MQKLINHINLYTKKSWIQFLIFSAILWLVFVHLHINRHLGDMIIGPHYWRKSDTFSQIMNYYYNGLNFFDHSYYFNQMDSNGKAVGEFPLFYYLIALQLKIFGNYPIIIKINYLVLLFVGQFSVFKIAYHFIKNFWLSIVTAFVIFLSPIFTYYMLAYLPDPIALNLMCIGLLFWLKSDEKKSKYLLWLALFFISWSSISKPFFMVPYLAVVLTIVFNQFWIKKDHWPKFNWLYLIPIVCLVLWYFYAQWYNDLAGCDCFLSEPRPIWNETSEAISRIWSAMMNRWLPEYIHPNFLWVLGCVILVNLIWWTKKTILINVFNVLVILGSVSFVLLFFNMFEYHDYYIFPVLFVIPVSVGVFFYKLTLVSKSKMVLSSIGLLAGIFIFFGLNYSWDKNENRRKTDWINSRHIFENYNGLEYFLTKNKVDKNTFVFTFSDKSPSMALSLINRKGWSGFQTKPNKYALDELIDQGTDYLILNKRAPILLNDSVIVNNFLNYPIDDTNDIYLYDLKPYKNK